MTRETVAKMPQRVQFMLKDFNKDYHNNALDKDEVRAEIAGYVLGLRDAGLITERERQILFVYATV